MKMNSNNTTDVTENPLYHDTWELLKNYRDVVWGLELSVRQLRKRFSIEYGSSVDKFLDSLYIAGADLTGSNMEHHAKCIEKSNQMVKMIDSSIELLRNRHKEGESYYWLIYFTYLCPQKLRNVDDIIEQLRPYIRDISYRTYYRKRKAAIAALSSILWGYTSRECMDILDKFFPDTKTGT